MSVLDRLDALEREQQCQGCERRCECPVCTAHPQLIAAVRKLREAAISGIAGEEWWKECHHDLSPNLPRAGFINDATEEVDALITAAAPMLGGTE